MTKVMDACCKAENLAMDVMTLAEGHRKETMAHKRLLVAFRLLRQASDEMRLANKDL